MKKTQYQREDFSNSNEIRWCPGCGDYAILSALQRALPEIGLPPEKHVVISGIGCAGRLPYYLNTYGYHTIHGRATAVATGLQAVRDDVCVWVVTGDGDALSIGGNHLLHCLRRNVNINILLVNNQVYGLTKGQFSPTSQPGQITKTSPQGLQQNPINPIALALAAGATFVARAVDKDPNCLAELLVLAQAHQGCSFIEIYQDCHIFNHGAFDAFALKANRAINTIPLENGKPLYFGEQQEHALVWDNDVCERISADGAKHYLHDTSSKIAAMRLAMLQFPDYPVPLGVYYQKEQPVFSIHGHCTKTMADVAALLKGN